MAEFGPQETNISPVQNFVTPKEGVASPSPLAAIADTASDIFTLRGKRKEAEANAMVADYMRRDVLIADAYAQNPRMTQAYVQNQLRRNLIDFMEQTDNPDLIKAYVSGRSGLLGIEGGLNVVREGTQTSQQRQRLTSTLVDNGLLSTSQADDPAAIAEAETIYSASQAAQFAWEQKKRYLDEITADLNLSEKQSKQLQQQRADAATEAIRGMGPAQTQQFALELNRIATNPNVSPAERVEQIAVYAAQYRQGVYSEFDAAGSDVIDSYLTSFEDLVDLYSEKATGQLEADALESQVQELLGRQKLLFTLDPRNAKIAAASEILNAPNLIQTQNLLGGAYQGVVEFFRKTADGETINPFDPNTRDDALQSYVDALLKGAQEGDPNVVQEAYENLNNVLGGIGEYEGSLRKDAKKGIAPARLFAQKSFLEAVQKNPDLLNELGGARDAMQQYYGNEVWLMVKEEFRESTVSVAATGNEIRRRSKRPLFVPSPEEISVEWTSNGLRFTANDPDNPTARRRVRKLNKELKPVIETTVRAMAHLEGSSDYKGIWDQVGNDILSGGADTSGIEGGADDDVLTSEDFAITQPLAENAKGLVGLIDKTEGGGEYDTLLAFSNRGTGKFADTDVTQMTLGEVKEFSQAGGDYAEFSKGQVGRMATPMGRYQIVGKTLRYVQEKMGLSDNVKFDQQTQDAMFAYLVKEALRGKTSDEAKRKALRDTWEGFGSVSDAELDQAIKDFEVL